MEAAGHAFHPQVRRLDDVGVGRYERPPRPLSSITSRLTTRSLPTLHGRQPAIGDTPGPRGGSYTNPETSLSRRMPDRRSLYTAHALHLLGDIATHPDRFD